jgi:hypothetical protein
MGNYAPVDHLQIVCDGKVERDLDLSSDRTAAYVEGELPFESSGWCVLRAFSDKAEYPILDLYPYATTSPVRPFKRTRVNSPDADRCGVVRVRIHVNLADV